MCVYAFVCVCIDTPVYMHVHVRSRTAPLASCAKPLDFDSNKPSDPENAPESRLSLQNPGRKRTELYPPRHISKLISP